MNKKKEKEILERFRKAETGREIIYLLMTEEQTPLICETAVKMNPYYLKYVREQTPEICMIALQSEKPLFCGGSPFQFVKDQTPELCLAAIKQDPTSIGKVLKQTQELCMMAVKTNGLALEGVRNQTLDVCVEAVKQNKFAFDCIKDIYIKDKVKEMFRESLTDLLAQAKIECDSLKEGKQNNLVEKKECKREHFRT